MSSPSETSLLLENQLCFAIYAASRKVIHLYSPMLKEMEISYTQYLTMLSLWEKPIQAIKDLGQALQLDTGTLTPMLKKMEQKKLITRTRSTHDERMVMIELTPAGLALQDIARRHLETLYCSTQIDPGSLIDLRNRLQQLTRLLDECPPE